LFGFIIFISKSLALSKFILYVILIKVAPDYRKKFNEQLSLKIKISLCMVNFKNTLVIIPARGGSKRIPKKNIKLINGSPMISWPLAELKKIFKPHQIIVSTDDYEIKAIVESHGLKIPFLRPEKLSDDYTGTMEVASHALDWYENNISKVDHVLIVYPTAVLLSNKDLKLAFRMLEEDQNCDGVFSACNFPFPIQRAMHKQENGYARMIDPSYYLERSQDLPETFHDAGQFYWYTAKAVKEVLNINNTNIKALKLHRNKVIDIDTPEDFDVAEQMLKFFVDESLS